MKFLNKSQRKPKRTLSEEEKEFLILINALLHQYESDFKSQEYFESIGCLFEYSIKKGYKNIEKLLKSLKKTYGDEISKLGLRYEVNEYIPFFERVIVDRNPLSKLHDDVVEKGGIVIFSDFTGDILDDLLSTVEYHGISWNKKTSKIKF